MDSSEETETDDQVAPSSQESRFSIVAGWSTSLGLLFVVMILRWALTSQTPTTGPAHRPAYLVDINSASMSEFRALPEIGDSLAQRIVDYREQMGPFRSVEDLEQVRGLGPKTLQSLRQQLSINPGSLELVHPLEPKSIVAR